MGVAKELNHQGRHNRIRIRQNNLRNTSAGKVRPRFRGTRFVFRRILRPTSVEEEVSVLSEFRNYLPSEFLAEFKHPTRVVKGEGRYPGFCNAALPVFLDRTRFDTYLAASP